MLFSIIPTRQVSEALNEKSDISNSTAIQLTIHDIIQHTTSLYTLKKQHCFYFDLSLSTEVDTVSLIKEATPFFFNTHYIKIDRIPLLFVSLSQRDIKAEKQVIDLITNTVAQQGFSNITVQFIYTTPSNNFDASCPMAYYISGEETLKADSLEIKNVIELLLSGKLIGKFLLVYGAGGKRFIDETVTVINKGIDSFMAANINTAKALELYSSLLLQYNNLHERSILLEQQLQNTQLFLGLTRDSFNHDLFWYKSETQKVKEWSTAEIRRLKEWHYWQYEVLPPWFKKMGKRILRFSKPKKGFEE